MTYQKGLEEDSAQLIFSWEPALNSGNADISYVYTCYSVFQNETICSLGIQTMAEIGLLLTKPFPFSAHSYVTFPGRPRHYEQPFN